MISRDFSRQATKRPGLRFHRGLAGNLAEVDVLEEELVTVVLELDLAGGIDRLIALPVVLHRHVVHYELVVEVYRHLISDHENPEAIPLADGPIRHLRRIARVLLIVVETAGAERVVPDLH